jgi:gamma-glutamyltranspeptidase/glutathione hydrolase
MIANQHRRGVPGLLGAFVGLMLSGACAAPADVPRGGPPVFPEVSQSAGAMVVTGSPYATEAGLRMLRAGGNAVDAAVAAAFALGVAEPTQSGLGGRSQFLFRGSDGSVHGIDGTTEVPGSYDPSDAPTGEHGHSAVGIPGSVAALTRALEEHGTVPLDAVMRPAIEWARKGVVPTRSERERIRELVAGLGPESTVTRALRFGSGPDGSEVLTQPDLARTLETLAREGRTAFYSGAIADAISADMAEHGGYVTRSDLAAYEALDSELGTGRYRGLEVVGSYLPASGVTVIQILQVIEHLDVDLDDDAEWASAIAEALLAGFQDREIAEGLQSERAVAWLTSDSLAERRASEVMLRIAGERPAVTAGGVDAGSEPAFTSHISVVDSMGNAVALTQSLGPSGGARVMTPGLGFLYASTLGGYLSGGGPGYRPWSSQAPLIAWGEGASLLVMGGAGSRRIVSALVATVSRIADHGMDVESALRAPRLHPTGGELLIDEGWGVAEELVVRGYLAVPTEDSYFARLNVIHAVADRVRGVGEPGWEGSSAAGLPPG